MAPRDRWAERLARDLAELNRQVAGLQRGQAERSRRDEADRRAVDPSLARLGLTQPFRIAPQDRADLGAQLQDRLRDDGAMPYHDAGSGAIYSANLLKDPLMFTILGGGPVDVGSSWTSIGGQWEARVRSISGAVPNVTARRTHSRKQMEGHIYKSDVVVFDIEYGAVGASWVEMRPKTAVPAPVHIEWPWCVPAVRCYVDKLIRPWTNLVPNDPDEYEDDDESDDPEDVNFVRMALVNGDWPDDDDPDETGDEADLEELSDDRMETQVYVGTEDVDKTHWWLLQIRTQSQGAGGIAVGLAEPQMHYTYQEAPMPFDPDVGNYDPCLECGGGGVIFDPDCEPGPATGGSLTFVSETHYHERHEGPPPGSITSFDSGGTDSHTHDVGSSPGTVNYPHTAPPSWSVCSGIGTGTFAHARHTGLWRRYTVGSKPTEGRAGLAFTVTCTSHSFTPRIVGLIVKPYSAPTSVLDGGLITSMPLGIGSMTGVIPASLIPPVGQDFWVGIVPISQSPEGIMDCNPGDWPYATGFGEAWRSNWEFTAAGWVLPCVIPPGQEFHSQLVGIGDGVADTFTGWSVMKGSTDWFVDGLLTRPLSFDTVTGVVIFDRAVAFGAEVMQSGVSL